MSPGVHLSTLVKCCIYVAVNHRVLQPIFTNYNPTAASYIEIILVFYISFRNGRRLSIYIKYLHTCYRERAFDFDSMNMV